MGGWRGYPLRAPQSIWCSTTAVRVTRCQRASLPPARGRSPRTSDKRPAERPRCPRRKPTRGETAAPSLPGMPMRQPPTLDLHGPQTSTTASTGWRATRALRRPKTSAGSAGSQGLPSRARRVDHAAPADLRPLKAPVPERRVLPDGLQLRRGRSLQLSQRLVHRAARLGGVLLALSECRGRNACQHHARNACTHL